MTAGIAKKSTPAAVATWPIGIHLFAAWKIVPFGVTIY
jgi:hypothetical protein